MPAPNDPLAALGRERDALLDRIVHTLTADPRVAAAWLSGSFGRDEDDAWSDLDLHIAIEDQHLDAFLAERPALYARVGRPILVQGEMPSDSQADARFQLVYFTGPVEVDWNIGPRSSAQRPAATRLLFDRAGIPPRVPPPLAPEARRARATAGLTFFWAMAPIAVKLAGRGDSRRAANQVTLLTTAYISLWRLVHDPHGPEPHLPAINRPLESEIDGRLPTLASHIDPPTTLAVIRALCDEVQRLHPPLAALGATVSPDMLAAVRDITAIAESVITSGAALPRRKFR